MPLNGSDSSILAEAARLFAAASHVKLLGVSTVTCLSPVLAVWQARASQGCFRPHADVAFFVGAVQRVLTCGSLDACVFFKGVGKTAQTSQYAHFIVMPPPMSETERSVETVMKREP